MTAITFVAMGTSLPDTFASKQAAECGEFADAAIGNVTGSNSVNVFLGLGLPWVLAAVFYAASDRVYQVPAGKLGFSVIVFTICAIACLGTLVIRRKVVGGELGGGATGRYGTAAFFFSMWLLYIILSSMNVMDKL